MSWVVTSWSTASGIDRSIAPTCVRTFDDVGELSVGDAGPLAEPAMMVELVVWPADAPPG